MSSLERSQIIENKGQSTDINYILNQIYSEIKSKYNNIKSYLENFDKNGDKLISEQEFI